MCPSDDVPCNARYLGDDLSDRGLQQALDRLVRQARQIQAAQGDACDCADRPRRPRIEEPETPESTSPIPVPVPTPIPIPAVNQTQGPAARQPGVPFVFDFFNFPMEIRDMIYEQYFADVRRLLTEIAAVRVRQDPEGSETRIRRYLRDAPRERRRFVFDPRYQDERPNQWQSSFSTETREMAAITYEASASDDALAELPSDSLALLRVSRDMRYEAGEIFFQHFRFTHPRDLVQADNYIYHGIMAAEAFFTDRSANERRRFRQIEIDLGPSPPVRGGPAADIENTALTGRMMDSPQRTEPTSHTPSNWTNGLNRLGNLSNILRQMEFQHLTLNFTGQPVTWWERGVTVSGETILSITKNS